MTVCPADNEAWADDEEEEEGEWEWEEDDDADQEVAQVRKVGFSSVYLPHLSFIALVFIKCHLQGWAKEWSLGCVNTAY